MATLLSAGYSVLVPEGTFYLWSKWADSDPQRQWNALADRDVFVLPGSMMNAPDYFRISLTASDEMVERALPAFIDVAWREGKQFALAPALIYRALLEVSSRSKAGVLTFSQSLPDYPEQRT
jgi:hypothetical protein